MRNNTANSAFFKIIIIFKFTKLAMLQKEVH